MIQAKPDHQAMISKATLTLDMDDIETGVASWSLMSPEHIEVEDLDEIFQGF